MNVFTHPLRRLSTGLAVSCLLLSPGLSAHETWLLPETFQPEADSQITLSMTSGMAFPTLGSGISAARIREAVISQNGQRDLLIPMDTRGGALELIATPGAGTACAWIALNPRILEIKPEAVAHYLEEIGADDSVWEAWNTQPEPRFWKESYSKLARTYLRSASDDAATEESSCWSDESASRFEILPLNNPTSLAPGETLELQVLFDREPLTNQAVGLWQEGDDAGVLHRSDDDGQVSLEFAGDGPHMIYATHLRPQMGEGFNWESDFVTLTVMVDEDS
ncbi:DUF4198 domain-containing protein [Congregibacter litoralis]|uniref:ABC-type Co2+ transport system, periplasmic component n=1 Tax=Congregibacter litoralis KT71 TaxID=314285 RepID=A4A8T7_9GAMM|nr:DUF4198 domain-containing protein [Congregibacter litoralis]EAQ97479.1 Domain protein of unknown function [Congregibacter litoralis KT71]